MVSLSGIERLVRAAAALASLTVAAMALFGCAKSSVQRDPPTSCAKLGDSCTYAPGKLGLCVEAVDGRRGLVCQSQH
jgi:hypothetical protein